MQWRSPFRCNLVPRRSLLTTERLGRGASNERYGRKGAGLSVRGGYRLERERLSMSVLCFGEHFVRFFVITPC